MDLLLRLAWRNIWRHGRRSVLTLLAIAFGVVLLVFNIGIQQGSYDVMIDNTVRMFHGHIQVQRKGYLDTPRIRTSIPNVSKLAAGLRKATGLETVSARATGFALVSSRSRSYGVIITGVDPKYEPRVSSIPGTVRQGRYLSGPTANEAVVGSSLAKNLKIKIGDELTLLGSGRDGSVAATVIPVVGIFNSGSTDFDRHMVHLPLQTFQELFTMGDHGHAVVILGKNLEQLPDTMARVKNYLGPDSNLVALDWEQLLPGIKELIELDIAASWFIYITLVVIITFSILNTFLMSVLERTREFGIMMALGATPFRIGILVMLEAFVMSLLGIGIGLFLGAAINYYFYVYGFSVPGMEEFAKQFNMPDSIQPQMSFFVFSIGPSVVLGATMIAALYPALRIRLLKPVDAMHAV
jgi:putative ABC transport system permease protein